jgi:hypothetical protein
MLTYPKQVEAEVVSAASEIAFVMQTVLFC